ncbi:hypothetical protein JCM3765_003209, partial [Sporobolomyces pararoseus]
VMVDSTDRRARYKSRGGDTRASKLFPRWDGPYKILKIYPETSTYKLLLPFSDRAHPVFHSSKLKPYKSNNPELFPEREAARPEPIDVEGQAEYVIEKILDEGKVGRWMKYLVKWEGYPEDEATWETQARLNGTEALEVWRRRKEGENE